MNFSFENFSISSVPQDNVGGDSFVDKDLHEMRKKIESRKGKQKRLKIIFCGLSIAVVALLASTLYSQYKLHNLTQAESEKGTLPVSLQTGEDVIKALSRHILLPKDTPQIAEIKDASKLRETQSFFKDTQNGDIVALYQTTIFIYRPSLDIVVAAGDVSGVGQINP